jgi:glycerophosphoryl diester phosphodiesterase
MKKTPALLTALLAPLATQAAPDWNVTDHIPLANFTIQAHRGAGDLAEEGTLESFQLGWSLGTVPEADVRATADGVIISFHDNNFKRILPNAPDALRKSSVEKQTWDFVKNLDVGSWKDPKLANRRAAKMQDIFNYMSDKPSLRLYVDIKKVDFAKLAALVKAANVENRVIIASNKPEFLVEWKQHAPASGTLLWCAKSPAEITAMLDNLIATGNIKHITSLQLHVHPNRNSPAFNPATDGGSGWKTIPCTNDPAEPFNHPRAFIKALGQRLRSLNVSDKNPNGILYQAFAYSNDASFYAPLLDLGVASFATDHPDLASAEVKKYYAAKRK